MKLAEIHMMLADIRKERNMAQKDIANALNVEQATISMYENGKRSIPLDLLDAWLQLLEIEITVEPKSMKPVQSAKDIERDLHLFQELKHKRNYLIAELRAQMAEKLMQTTEFQTINHDTGENQYWPYSFLTDERVGLVETRCDHPEQKYVAVEYTGSETNVYRFLSSDETVSEQQIQNQFSANRIYFSEDDFLTFETTRRSDCIKNHKKTVLQKSTRHPGGTEIVEPEGFSISTLLEMQKTQLQLSSVIEEVQSDWNYVSMKYQLDNIKNRLLDIAQSNQLRNGTLNPDFVIWSSDDLSAIDVPLWSSKRNWYWLKEGVKWVEEPEEFNELPAMDIPTEKHHVDHQEHEPRWKTISSSQTKALEDAYIENCGSSRSAENIHNL